MFARLDIWQDYAIYGYVKYSISLILDRKCKNLSFELKSEKYMPEDTGLEWFVFTDIGSIWGTDYKSGVRGFDDKKPRISNGFGLSMKTPVGPLQMVWGFPVQSETYDIEENFQFSIGTTF